VKKKISNRFKQIAFTVSICLFVLWGILGTSTSIAWFSDTSEELKNVFHIADFDLQVFYRDENGNWDELRDNTELFDREALYEPGYVQTVYLKVKNNGSVPFLWNTMVSVYGYVEGINKYGDSFKLQEYLKFGVGIADTEAEMDKLVETREKAVSIANEDLGEYSTNQALLKKGEEAYITLVVRMPEEVTNVANYEPPHQPEVLLRVIVSATQQNPNN